VPGYGFETLLLQLSVGETDLEPLLPRTAGARATQNRCVELVVSAVFKNHRHDRMTPPQ
jgi:hypothetical protein